MNTYEIRQMELRLESKSWRLARQGRERAQWWFAQMRRVVDAAMEWSPESQGTPAQDYLALAGKRT